MEKLFFIFLLLGSVILSGCGSDDFEDPAPRLVSSSPSVNENPYYGTKLALTFSEKIQVSSVNLNTVYVVPASNQSDQWPVIPTEIDGTCGEVEFSVDDGEQPVAIKTQTFNINILASDCVLPSGTDLILVVTTNVKSTLGVALDKVYRIPFTTGD